MGMLLIGFLGGCIGLLLAVLGNIVLLPYVLERQAEWLGVQSKQQIAGLTTFVYRFVMPLMFTVVGVIFAIEIFGDVR